MMFDAEVQLQVLKTKLQDFGHPRADAQASRLALERALGLAQLALSNFRESEYQRPKALYGELVCAVEMAKQVLRTAPAEPR